MRAGPLSIDLVCRMATLEGKRVRLTRKEYTLLHLLAPRAGLVVTHQQLLKEIWGSPAANIHYLRILVRKLRQKVEFDPTRRCIIISESRVGYRLDPSASGPCPAKAELRPIRTAAPERVECMLAEQLTRRR